MRSFLHIQDAPRFEYRGFMIDVARNFRTKDEVIETIEVKQIIIEVQFVRNRINTQYFHNQQIVSVLRRGSQP